VKQAQHTNALASKPPSLAFSRASCALPWQITMPSWESNLTWALQKYGLHTSSERFKFIRISPVGTRPASSSSFSPSKCCRMQSVAKLMIALLAWLVDHVQQSLLLQVCHLVVQLVGLALVVVVLLLSGLALQLGVPELEPDSQERGPEPGPGPGQPQLATDGLQGVGLNPQGVSAPGRRGFGRPVRGGIAGCAAKQKGPRGRANHVALICSLLQRMGGPLRHKVIEGLMQQDERLALEAYMHSQKNGRKVDDAKPSCHDFGKVKRRPDSSGGDTSSGDSEPNEHAEKGCGGIYKSANGDRVYGYFAKAGLRNLVFFTRIQQDLVDAVHDHIILTKTLERIRCENADKAFPLAVQIAVASVMAEEGLQEQRFLRGFSVSFSAHHWIGRGLSVHRNRLDRALEAWQRFEIARGVPLFKGSTVFTTYTPMKAQEQWQRVREAFIQLQTEDGRLPRSQVEEYLAAAEASYRPMFERKVAAFLRRQWRQATHGGGREKRGDADADSSVLRRVEAVLRAWRRDVAREQRQRKRAEYRKQMDREKLGKKRLWDGKESLADFQRRVNAEVKARRH